MNIKFGEELREEVEPLYSKMNTFLYLERNWPVSENELNLWNFFAVISRSLWCDIVVSIGRFILDKRKDTANFGWFIDKFREEKGLSEYEHREITSKFLELQTDFKPFRDARNKVFAHINIELMQRGDPVNVDADLNEIEKLMDKLWSLYNELSEKALGSTVLPPIIGRAGLEQLQYIMREYNEGPYRQIHDAMKSNNYNSFTAHYDFIEDNLHVKFFSDKGEAIEDTVEQDTVQHFKNGRLIGLTISRFSNR